jgi:hypothetical protein
LVLNRAKPILVALAMLSLARCSMDVNVGEVNARTGPGEGSAGSAPEPVPDASGFDASLPGDTSALDAVAEPGATRGDVIAEVAQPIDVSVSDGRSDVAMGVDAREGIDARDAVAEPAADVSIRDAGDAGICVVGGAVCARGDDCCSGFCIGNVCTTPTVCQGPGTACTRSGSCCSGRCDLVVTGSSVVCRPSCSADGLPCARPQDCCSLACTNGTCGGAMCKPRDGTCTTPLDCCSMICDTSNRCQRANDDVQCRPAGEECDDTEPNECCFGCNTTTGRCSTDPTACRGLGADCTTGAQCCEGVCAMNAQGRLACQIPCLADGAACTMGAECCGFACTGSPRRCGLPPGRACAVTGSTCQSNDQCCSRYCSGGFCDLLCQLPGVRCLVPTDCCSGICTAGLCQKAPAL